MYNSYINLDLTVKKTKIWHTSVLSVHLKKIEFYNFGKKICKKNNRTNYHIIVYFDG